MSDAELRQLWRGVTSPEEEGAFLARALRRGLLSPERLELAAYCGDPAAQEAIGTTERTDATDLVGFVVGLRPFGPPAYLRASWAVVRALDAEERFFGFPSLDLPAFARAALAVFAGHEVGLVQGLGMPSTIPIGEVGFATYFARRLQAKFQRRVLRPQPESLSVEDEVRRELANWALGRADALGDALRVVAQ